MDDLISRQAAIEGFYEMASDIDHLCSVSDYVRFLESLTSMPQRKNGEWVHGKEKSREMRGGVVVSISYDGWYCSECGKKVEDEFRPFYRFCRYCGADNQSTKRSEDDSE